MTNAHLELVQLDKKAELILSDSRFATIHKVKVGHLYAAQSQNDLEQAIKLIALVTRIDDKALTLEEVLNLPVEDFHKIMTALSK